MLREILRYLHPPEPDNIRQSKNALSTEEKKVDTLCERRAKSWFGKISRQMRKDFTEEEGTIIKYYFREYALNKLLYELRDSGNFPPTGPFPHSRLYEFYPLWREEFIRARLRLTPDLPLPEPVNEWLSPLQQMAQELHSEIADPHHDFDRKFEPPNISEILDLDKMRQRAVDATVHELTKQPVRELLMRGIGGKYIPKIRVARQKLQEGFALDVILPKVSS